MLRFQIQKFVAVLNASVLMVSLMYSVYVNWNDKIILTKVVCFADAVVHLFVQMFFSTIHYDRIQALVEQVQEYCANVKPYEKRILQRYLDKYSKPYGMTASWFYLTPTFFFIGTMFLPQPFPIDAAYPFPVDYEPLRSAIFLHHGFVCMQCTSIVCNNVFAAMLMFFAAARFEIVAEEFRAVESMETLIQALQKYYRVKRYELE
ncbi:uncharacterized protein LOC143341744 [Colletes latitarsis]|uniref:uncharacterized protein LOC143341744 n=1 Tax=Colletes latitarsis TaxID=2605962 RepID=UPI004035D755